MIRFAGRWLIAGLLVGLTSVAGGSAGAAERAGVVLLHGKGGMPESRMMDPLIAALRDAEFLVSTPEMPWSRARRYNGSYEAALDEIARAVAAIRARGATKIVVAGQSQGANAALGFGARRGGVAGIAAIAPGHVPEYFATLDDIASALARAKALVAAGRGDETAEYPDVDQADRSFVATSARIYVSYFDPDGPAVMWRNAAGLRPGTALLWIYGEKDRPNVRRGRGYAFDRAPPNPLNRYVVVDGGHEETPSLGAARIVDWINSLK
jgi:pimeloyl-ACP methyl ester carboxylesterase